MIKEETSEHEEFDFESNYMDPGEEDEGEEFSQDVFYPDHSNDPGPSGISGICSNHSLIKSSIYSVVRSRNRTFSNVKESSLGFRKL